MKEPEVYLFDDPEERPPMDDKVPLLPCPFCGSSAIFIEYDHGDYLPEEPDYMVRCEGEGMHQLDHVGHKDELAKVWNRRQAQEAPNLDKVDWFDIALQLQAIVGGSRMTAGELADWLEKKLSQPVAAKAQEAPKAASVDHLMSAKPLAEYLNQISQNETPFEACSPKVQRAYLEKATYILGFLQPAFAAQRQAGREEMREELRQDYEDWRNKIEGQLAKRYSAVVDAARVAKRFLESEDCEKGVYQREVLAAYDRAKPDAGKGDDTQ